MTEEKIQKVLKVFCEQLKKLYGETLSGIILYGSCARGDFSEESDIDILVLLSVAPEKIGNERNKALDLTADLDMTYDVVLAPVFQSEEIYRKYMPVSVFYQNVEREGVRVA